jgi:nitroreductase
MDVYDAINARRTIRDFEDRPIEMRIIEKIIDAGLKAPTNDHMRSWEFVVVQDKTVRAEILRAVPEGYPATKPGIIDMLDSWGMTDTVQRDMYLDSVPKQYAMLYNAGCLILPFFKTRRDVLKPEEMISLAPLASIWLCIENMLLAATAEGIFGVTKIPVGNEPQHVKNVLRHPDDYVLPCYIALGYPAKGAVINAQKEVSAKVKIHLEKW